MTCQELEITDCTFSFSIPKGAKILFKKNEEVKKGNLLITEEEEEFQEFDLSSTFSVSPKKVSRYLTLSPGSKVEKGQIIVLRDTLFGKKIEFRSPVVGTLVQISDRGVLKIKLGMKKKEVCAPIGGKIKEIGESFLVLEFKGLRIIGNWGKGAKFLGILSLGEEKGEAKLRDICSQQAGKILVFGGRIPLGVCHKAETLGIKGLVGGLASQEIEPSELAIVTFEGKDGFIPKEIWQELKKKEGEEIVISGSEKYLAIPLS